MTNAIATRKMTFTSYTADLPDGTSIDLPFEADEMVDPFLSDDGNTFRYAVSDECGHEYEFPEGVEFAQGNPGAIHYTSDVEGWLEGVNDDSGLTVFAVDVYQHGNIMFSLSGTGPQCQFDTARGGACIAIPNDFTDSESAASSILAEYTAWCNGDVYGLVEMKRDPATGQWAEGDSVWGFYGWEHMETVVKEGY